MLSASGTRAKRDWGILNEACIYLLLLLLLLLLLYLQLGSHPVAAVQYTFTHKQYTEYRERNVHKKNWEIRAVPRICELCPGICVTTEEKARKNLTEQEIKYHPRHWEKYSLDTVSHFGKLFCVHTTFTVRVLYNSLTMIQTGPKHVQSHSKYTAGLDSKFEKTQRDDNH
jgi:hypothetical protein